MADEHVASFSTEAINQALEAAQSHGKELTASAVNHEMDLVEGSLSMHAQCISVTVQNHQVCINLPFKLGKKCIKVPSWVPNGASVQACLDICTRLGFPCGVKITASFNNKPIFTQTFGCSC